MNQKNKITLFLTSSPDASYQKPDGTWVTGPFTSKNGFLNHFRKACPQCPWVLLITAAPDEKEKNQEMQEYFTRVFAASQMKVKEMKLLERATADYLDLWLPMSDLVILGGGHVPTQNRFFQQIELKKRLDSFEGVIMGISAGSMNCAELVYAQPELTTEAVNPNYKRFIKGLGLTRQNVLPHYQMVKDYRIDGFRLMEEITYPDSVGREFYALEDGSYILCENGKETLFGNAYRIADGQLEKICGDGEMIELED